MKKREIVSEVLNQDSIIFNFDDASTVWVIFKPEVAAGKSTIYR